MCQCGNYARIEVNNTAVCEICLTKGVGDVWDTARAVLRAEERAIATGKVAEHTEACKMLEGMAAPGCPRCAELSTRGYYTKRLAEARARR